jgi:predicted transcriptional regulator
MSFRVTPQFKAKLDQVAKESGRSLAQELELRLERSLDEERYLTDALELGFGRQVAGLMLAIGYLIKEMVPARRPGHIGWLSNPEVFGAIAKSIDLFLQVIDPTPHPAASAVLRRTFDDSTSGDPELYASTVAGAIADRKFAKAADAVEFMPLIPTIRSWLGKAIVARLRDRLLKGDTTSAAQEE